MATTRKTSPRAPDSFISTLPIESRRLSIFDPDANSMRFLDVSLYPRDGSELGEIAQAHFENYIGYATGPVSLAEFAIRLLEIAESEPRVFIDFDNDEEPEDLYP
jgi:hypothetical protein